MSRLGHYEIERELGRGMMGVVYLARDGCLQRQVALKTINVPPGLADGEVRSYRDRLMREAQTAGSISHPGIVTVYAVEEAEGADLPFITMEYVAGRDLRRVLLKEGPLDPERALIIADALADALHTAHDAGIVHRDIKPANILVRDTDGAVKVADFGVARLSMTELTHAGTIVGSPAYFSPEQVRSGTADARSDLFSLAIVLYEMLCGQRPFPGEELPTIVHSLLNDEPLPITQRRQGLPRSLDAFFKRALAKNPAERYLDGAAFRSALGEILLELQICKVREIGIEITSSAVGTGAVPVDATRRGRQTGHYLAVGVLLLAFVLGWMFRGKSVAPPPDLIEQAPVSTRSEPPLPTAPPEPVEPPTAIVTQPTESVVAERILIVEPPPVEPEPIEAPKPDPVGPPEVSVQDDLPAVIVPQTEEPAISTRVLDIVVVADADPVPPGPPLGPAGELATTWESAVDPVAEQPVAAPIPVIEPAVLTVEIRSSVKQGALILLIDGEAVHVQDVTTNSKIFGRLYQKTVNKGQKTFLAEMDVTPGRHEILVKLERPGKVKPALLSASVEFISGEARQLHIVAGRLLRSPLTMKVE